MLVQRGPIMIPPGGGGGGHEASSLPPDADDSDHHQQDQIHQIVVDNFLEMNQSIEINMEPSDNHIEDVMNGNLEDTKTEESLSSRDSFLTSSDNDDDDPPTLNESYTRHTNEDVGLPENTFSSLISDCGDLISDNNKSAKKLLTLSDSDVSSGGADSEEGHNNIHPLYDDDIENYGKGVTVHLHSTITTTTKGVDVNNDDTVNNEVKDHNVSGGVTETIMQASVQQEAKTTGVTNTHHHNSELTNFASLQEEESKQNDMFVGGEAEVLADTNNAANLVTMSEQAFTQQQDVQINFEQKLTETIVEEVTLDISESNVWQGEKRGEGSINSEISSSTSSIKLSASKDSVASSDKLRNTDIGGIQEKKVTTMIQRIEKISKSGGQFNQKSSVASLLDSPRLAHSNQGSPRVTVRPKDSPRLTAGPLDSPRLTAGPLDSPRLTASGQDSPRLGDVAGARKVEIVVDSYEVQLEKSLELTTGLEGREGETRGGIVKDTSAGLERTDTPVRSSIHRVTFNTRNEVASEDTDGSLLVTYCPLEERIRRRRDRSPVPPGREPYKVKYVDRNSPMTSSPRVIDFDDATFNADDDETQQNSSREIEGWENPFQPEGPVSQDADLILRLWKGGNLSEDLDSAINQLQVEEERAKTEAEELAAAELEAARLEAEQERAKAEKEADSKEKLSVDKTNGGSSSNRVNQMSIVNIDKQKHKNLIKKHCSLM